MGGRFPMAGQNRQQLAICNNTTKHKNMIFPRSLGHHQDQIHKLKVFTSFQNYGFGLHRTACSIICHTNSVVVQLKLLVHPKHVRHTLFLVFIWKKIRFQIISFRLKYLTTHRFCFFDKFLKKEKAIDFSRNSLNNVLPSYYILHVSDMLCFLLKQHCSLQKTSLALCTDERENNGKKTGRRPKIHQKSK